MLERLDELGPGGIQVELARAVAAPAFEFGQVALHRIRKVVEFIFIRFDAEPGSDQENEGATEATGDDPAQTGADQAHPVSPEREGHRGQGAQVEQNHQSKGILVDIEEVRADRDVAEVDALLRAQSAKEVTVVDA